MEEPKKRTSIEWMALHNIVGTEDIIDPDGWDRENFIQSLHEEITLEEFINRLSASTCKLHPKKEDGILKVYVGDLVIAQAEHA